MTTSPRTDRKLSHWGWGWSDRFPGRGKRLALAAQMRAGLGGALFSAEEFSQE